MKMLPTARCLSRAVDFSMGWRIDFTHDAPRQNSGQSHLQRESEERQ
jgi:hypothetical protein